MYLHLTAVTMNIVNILHLSLAVVAHTKIHLKGKKTLRW